MHTHTHTHSLPIYTSSAAPPQPSPIQHLCACTSLTALSSFRASWASRAAIASCWRRTSSDSSSSELHSRWIRALLASSSRRRSSSCWSANCKGRTTQGMSAEIWIRKTKEGMWLRAWSSNALGTKQLQVQILVLTETFSSFSKLLVLGWWTQWLVFRMRTTPPIPPPQHTQRQMLRDN